MTAELRRRLATILVGAMAMLTALLVATMIRQNRCAEAGGEWLAATRQCQLPSGGGSPSSGWAWALGVLAGLAVAVVMWRTYAFFLAGAARRAAARR